MSSEPGPVCNVDEVEEVSGGDDPVWGGDYKVLTPYMEAKGGELGMNVTRLAPGKISCPFHTHYVDDEVFYILSGNGVLRYGDEVHSVRPGDAISCPAGTGIAHQFANNGDEDLIFLGVGRNSRTEVVEYPDSGKVMVRRIGFVGTVQKTDFMDGEPEDPVLFSLIGQPGTAA